MTTIAWDLKELVTDGRQTLRDMILPTSVNKICLPEEDEYWEVAGVKCLAFSLAGMFVGAEYVKDLLRAGITYKTKFPEDVEMLYNAIFILEDHTAWIQTVTPSKGRTVTYTVPAFGPMAMGSGEAYAYSLLSIGKSAQAAVKHAMKLDIYSGGELSVFTLPPKPEVPSKRPEVPAAEQPAAKLADLNLDQLKDVIRAVVETTEPKAPSEDLLEAERDAGPLKVKKAPYKAA